MQQLRSHTAAIAAISSTVRAFATTKPARGLEQLSDMPISSDRIPTGKHSGPGRRELNKGEVARYQFVKKWELQMKEQWDSYESFKGQPKPKRQFGNESAEVIWPYALLLENPINIHRFTKSVYVYYPHKQESVDGAFAAAVAKRFSQQYLIPITFHNSQCYVETEMLVEYGEVPWVVIHCLDGRHAIIPIKAKAPAAASSSTTAGSSSSANSSDDSSSSAGSSSAGSSSSSAVEKKSGGAQNIKFSPIDIKAASQEILQQVVSKAAELGESVSNVNAAISALNERPPQNQYVRINYQWFGDTQEERSQHLVHWNWNEADVTPSTRFKDAEIRQRLNYDGRFPVASQAKAAVISDKQRIMKGRQFNNGARNITTGAGATQNARHSRGKPN